MPASRPRRTTISGTRAQFAHSDAGVVNLSSTGALVHAAQKQTPGALGPFTLEMDGAPLQLTARVVRCQPVASPLSASVGKFALALTFINPSPEATAWLEDICRTGPPVEGDDRRLRVSLTRRCPKCHSRDVAKEPPRSYSCCQCGRVFTGFRFGFLRFSR